MEREYLSALDDDILVARAVSGDTAAFATLVERYRRQVYALAYRRLRDACEADDAAQETFVRAYVHLASYRPGTRFASWLLAIAAHWCIDQQRRQACRMGGPFPPGRIDGRGIDRADQADGPEDLALAAERQRAIGTWVAALPADLRQVLHLYYAQELSYDEIAAALHQPVTTIRMRLHRARQRLARAGHPEYARAE